MFWFFMFFIWVWLLITVFADIFRSDDLGGGGKALWVIVVLVVPYLGVFVYLIARGHKMGERAVRDAEAQDVAARAYIRDAGRDVGQPFGGDRPFGRAEAAGFDRRRRVSAVEGEGRRLSWRGAARSTEGVHN